jgi:tetratricopeptide (TPR) repeat protein
LNPSTRYTGEEIWQAEETIRYWTTLRTPVSVSWAWQLFERLVTAVEHAPTLLQDDYVVHWYDGRYPRATHLLNAILDSWRICYTAPQRHDEEVNDVLSPRQVLSVLERWTAVVPAVPVNARTYTILLTAAIQRGQLPDTRNIDSSCSRGSNDFSRGDPTQVPIFAQDLLATMLERGLQHPAELPDAVMWTASIRAWALSMREDAAEGAWALWQDWHAMLEEQVVRIPPNTVACNTIMDVLMTQSSSDGGTRLEPALKADQLLQDMIWHGYYGVAPDTVSFQLIIFGWANVAERRLTAVEEDAYQGKEAEDAIDPLDQACQRLSDMLDLDLSGDASVQADATYFAKIISVAARQGRLELAENLYDQLSLLYERRGEQRFSHDIHVTRAMVILYAKSNRPVQAETLLYDMESDAATSLNPSILPKPSHYRDVIRCWAFPGRSFESEKAEQLLLRLIGLAMNMDETKDLYMPNERLIDMVLMSWTRTESGDAGFRAESLLRRIQNLYQETKHPSLLVGPKAFQHVVTAWSRTPVPEAAERAESLLFEMQHLYDDGHKRMHPTRSHYASVISAWAESGRHDAAASIQDWFDVAVESYHAGIGDARPDQGLYSATVTAYAKVGDANGAERHFRLMLKDFENGNQLAPPTATILNTVLLSLLRSNASDVQERAVALLDDMEALTRVGWFNAYLDDRSRSLAIEILSKSSSSKYAARIAAYTEQQKGNDISRQNLVTS